MKKIITLILAAALLFSLAVIPASAAGTTSNEYSVTMNLGETVEKEDAQVLETMVTESQRYKFSIAAARIDWKSGDDSDNAIFSAGEAVTYAGITCDLYIAEDNGVDVTYAIAVYGTPEKAGTYTINITLNFHMNEQETGFEMGTTQSRRAITVTVPGGEQGGDNVIGDDDDDTTSTLPSLDGNNGNGDGETAPDNFIYIIIGAAAAVVVVVVIIIIVASKKKKK